MSNKDIYAISKRILSVNFYLEGAILDAIFIG